MRLLYCFLLCSMVYIGLCGADRIEEPDESRESNILRRFFAMEGLSINSNDPTLVKRYYKEVIDRMEAVLENHTDILGFSVNEEVNKIIFNTQMFRKPAKNDCKPFEPYYEVIFRALDLMVPDGSIDEPVYQLAKIDLRKFYLEQPDLAKELLNRIGDPFKTKGLHTADLARLVRNFYYHWIPLGRLTRFIESNGDK